MPYSRVREDRPNDIVRLAVRRMLPKTKLGHDMLRRLKVYDGPEHPHAAQQPVKVSPAAKATKTPEELKEIGKKVTATTQTSLLDEIESTAEAKPAAKAPAEAKMATPQVSPTKDKKAKQFIDLVDELEFAVNSKSKKACEEKIAKINALGKELNTLGLFKSDADAMAAYTKQKALKAQAAELPEDDNDAPVFEGEEQEEATFED